VYEKLELWRNFRFNGFILRDSSLRDAAHQDEVSDPHGEERVFARLRTMLRIAGRTIRPQQKRQTLSTARLFPARPSPDIDNLGGSIR
jgi:hypothetical protein